jgi:hypothetical protein
MGLEAQEDVINSTLYCRGCLDEDERKNGWRRLGFEDGWSKTG